MKITAHSVVMHEDGRESKYRISYLCIPLDDTELARIPNDLINARNPVRKESLNHQNLRR